jgi:hypothetical protein
MPIMFNAVLREAGLPINDVILLRHQDQRAERGRTPYELWRDDTPAFDLYQSHQGTEARPKFSRAQYWASFVVTPAGDTLFVGLYHAHYRGLLDHDTPWPHRCQRRNKTPAFLPVLPTAVTAASAGTR